MNTVGAQHVELVVDGKHGTLTVYVLGRHGHEGHPIASRSLTAHVKSALENGCEEPFDVVLHPIPLESDPEGSASRFVGTGGDLVGLERFDVAVELALTGEALTTRFSIDRAELANSFVCPMRCEANRIRYHKSSEDRSIPSAAITSRVCCRTADGAMPNFSRCNRRSGQRDLRMNSATPCVASGLGASRCSTK